LEEERNKFNLQINSRNSDLNDAVGIRIELDMKNKEILAKDKEILKVVNEKDEMNVNLSNKITEKEKASKQLSTQLEDAKKKTKKLEEELEAIKKAVGERDRLKEERRKRRESQRTEISTTTTETIIKESKEEVEVMKKPRRVVSEPVRDSEAKTTDDLDIYLARLMKKNSVPKAALIKIKTGEYQTKGGMRLYLKMIDGNLSVRVGLNTLDLNSWVVRLVKADALA